MKHVAIAIAVIAGLLGWLAMPTMSDSTDAAVCGPGATAGSTVQALASDAVSRAMTLLQHTC